MAALALTRHTVKRPCLYRFIQQRGQHQIHLLSATRRQKVMLISVVLLPGWGKKRPEKGACKHQNALSDAETERRTDLDLEEKIQNRHPVGTPILTQLREM